MGRSTVKLPVVWVSLASCCMGRSIIHLLCGSVLCHVWVNPLSSYLLCRSVLCHVWVAPLSTCCVDQSCVMYGSLHCPPVVWVSLVSCMGRSTVHRLCGSVLCHVWVAPLSTGCVGQSCVMYGSLHCPPVVWVSLVSCMGRHTVRLPVHTVQLPLSSPALCHAIWVAPLSTFCVGQSCVMCGQLY